MGTGMPDNARPTSGTRAGGFAPTRWSVVLSAAGDPAGSEARRALSELCGAYWFPLYAFVRRQGCGAVEAEDLTQEFFARLLEKNYLAAVDPAKGRFRSFLLVAMRHFLLNEWAKARAVKRGGGRRLLALDALDAEARYAAEPPDDLTPERLYERRWALAVLEGVLDRLRTEYSRAGKADLFETLKGCLTAEAAAPTHAEAARRLGMTEAAVRVAAHRLRRRYRDLLREEIAQTVADPRDAAEIEDEIGYLLRCL
jgi:RNA polymerase sigma factor (sigma-70 family)